MGSLAMSDAWGAWGPGQHQKNFFSFFVQNGLKMVFTKFERIWTTFSKIWTWPSGPVMAPEPRSEVVWLGSTDEKNWFVQNFFLIILVPKWADLEHFCWSTPRRDAWMGHLAMCDGVVGSETEGGQKFFAGGDPYHSKEEKKLHLLLKFKKNRRGKIGQFYFWEILQRAPVGRNFWPLHATF